MTRTGRQIGVVIAERTLERRDSPHRTVVVSLGKPRRTKGAKDWECPFRIRGSGMRRVEYGRGIDAFQALTMALEGIRYHFDRSGMRLGWQGVFEDQTGFQRVIPLSEPGVTRQMERVVDRELRRGLQRLKQQRELERRRGKVNPSERP
jgi:hypothetical protein